MISSQHGQSIRNWLSELPDKFVVVFAKPADPYDVAKWIITSWVDLKTMEFRTDLRIIKYSEEEMQMYCDMMKYRIISSRKFSEYRSACIEFSRMKDISA